VYFRIQVFWNVTLLLGEWFLMFGGNMLLSSKMAKRFEALEGKNSMFL
jgi:hypothetical protein